MTEPKPSRCTKADREFWDFVLAVTRRVKRWPRWKRVKVSVS